MFCIPGEFESFVKETEVFKKIPFTFDCNFISLHFGKDRERRISYAEFTQLIHVSFFFFYFIYMD